MSYFMHYSLGFPPYRTGGMTKFVMDFMLYQKENGHKVSLVWPGRINNRKTKIKKTIIDGLISFEICNPLPVSLCNGIRNANSFTKKTDEMMFQNFLSLEKPDVIHIHTLEGLHFEFLNAARKKGIKIIYTTHDYFGLCPTNFLFKENEPCNSPFDDCCRCNSNAFSMRKIMIMQSVLYRKLKRTSLFKVVSKKYRRDSNDVVEKDVPMECNYKMLKEYYKKCFSCFDLIHCNSSVSFGVFSKYIRSDKLVIKNITHKGIVDNRYKRNNVLKNKIKFCFIGSESVSKGFFQLINVLDRIWSRRKDFELIVYSQDDYVQREYINKHNKFLWSNIKNVFLDVDLLVVPSLWHETFGFIVLEAFSYGVPSLVTSSVGAKDIIDNNYSGFISDIDKFEQVLESLLIDKKIVLQVSENIKKKNIDISFDNIMSIYS